MRCDIRSSARSLSAGLVLFCLACPWTAESFGQNSTRFRGDNGDGVTALKGLPTTFSPGDYAFDIELPGVGHAAPVVFGDRLFVTSAIDEGAVRYLFCLNANTGEQLWSQSIGLNKSPKHVKSSWASSTPATDGERVYVCFADKEHYFVSAYDYAGNLAWRRNLGSFTSQHGLGVSPVLYEGLLIVPNDQDGNSSVIAFNAKTGETVWSTLRSSAPASYATPIIIRPKGGEPQLIVSSQAMGVTSLDPLTGEPNWQSGPFPLRTCGSPVYGNGLIYQSCGGGGIGKLMIGVDPGGKGDVSATHIKYTRDKIVPYVPTPIVYEGHMYLWGDSGVVSCLNLETGENVWTQRVGGNYSGSPICNDGKLYIMSEDGEMVVIAASPEYELLGKSPLNDPSHATPVIANGALYIRTFHRLACLKAKP